MGRLTQGLKCRSIEGTNTIVFIRNNNVQTNQRKDMQYYCITCDVQPQKKEKNRSRLMMSGGRINYLFDCFTPTDYMLTVKLLLNSVISTDRAKFTTLDIKNFYFMTLMKWYKYLRLNIANFPDGAIAKDNLGELARGTEPSMWRSGMACMACPKQPYLLRSFLKTACSAQLLPKKGHSRLLEARHTNHLVHLVYQ